MEKRATVSTSTARPATPSRPASTGRPPKPGRKGQGATRSRILGLAFGAGSLAALLAYFWLQSLSAPRKTNRPAVTVPVLMVARDIPARTLITKDMVEVRLVPAEQASAGALQDASEVIGKVTTVSIANGQPVTAQLVAPPDINMGMAFTLPPTYRAVSVALDPVSAVAGFIKPGDRVDVLATFKGEGSESVTCVVLQNIPLLATGSKALPGYSAAEKTPMGVNGAPSVDSEAAAPEAIPTATLMVNPEEAQALVLAASSGKIQLTLRSPNDKTRPALTGLTTAVFIHGKNDKASGVPAPFRAQKASDRAEIKPILTKAVHQVAPKPEAVKEQPAVPQDRVKVEPPPPPRPTREMALAGVMLGDTGFALLTAGKKEWYKRVGDTVAQYRVRAITEDGIWVQAAKGKRELWHVGETWTVLE